MVAQQMRRRAKDWLCVLWGRTYTARESVYSHGAKIGVGCEEPWPKLGLYDYRQLSQLDLVKARAGAKRGVTIPRKLESTIRKRVRMAMSFISVNGNGIVPSNVLHLSEWGRYTVSKVLHLSEWGRHTP